MMPWTFLPGWEGQTGNEEITGNTLYPREPRSRKDPAGLGQVLQAGTSLCSLPPTSRMFFPSLVLF